MTQAIRLARIGSGIACSRAPRVPGGHEPFPCQGIHAFHIFCGARVDAAALRRALDDAP